MSRLKTSHIIQITSAIQKTHNVKIIHIVQIAQIIQKPHNIQITQENSSYQDNTHFIWITNNIQIINFIHKLSHLTKQVIAI